MPTCCTCLAMNARGTVPVPPSLAYPATGVALWRTARSHATRSVARYSIRSRTASSARLRQRPTTDHMPELVMCTYYIL